MSIFFQPRRGFTLIELVVTIAIIGLILSFLVAGLTSARVKSRDAKRIGDIQTIQSALEHYAFGEAGHSYPDTIYGNPVFSQYLAVTPSDPKGNPYNYVKSACLTKGSSDGTSTFAPVSDPTTCVRPNQQYGAYGLHALLENNNHSQAKQDASPADGLSYDVLP